ncbi:MAG: alpha/beta fold hydrolase [Planctomyces sp.]
MNSIRVLLIPVLLLQFTELRSEEVTLRFRPHQINADSKFDSCSVMDVNADGRRDIISGDSWYEAPDWKKHPLRTVEQIRGRFDDYSSLPVDVNGDGFTDLVSANYRSQSLYWVQNPGPMNLSESVPWERHVIAEPGAMETGRLFDVDGDGVLDILPNGIKFAAWWRFSPGDPVVWTRYPLPEQLAGHGIGGGDVNGDRRADLVGRFGWAEAPEDRRTGRWIFHDEFQIERDASVPMVVHDFDQDGDADILWGRGHKIGIHWLEQTKSESGARTWKRHAIDTSWSQAHSLLFADLTGDGKPELIAGKRWLGHDGKDPGEYDPLISYSFEFVPKTLTWRRHLIHLGGNIGFGLDPKAEDVDSDGDIDLIVSDRCGLNWLENLRLPDTQAEKAETADSQSTPEADGIKLIDSTPLSDHQNILFFKDHSGNPQPVTTPFEMATRRHQILSGMSEAMGQLPSPERRVPLDMVVESEETTEHYHRKRISFASEPGDRVPAWLLIPRSLEGRGPAMLCLHQTTGIGKGEPAGLGGLPNLHYAHELAQRGFVCIVPDYPSFGDYAYDFRTQGKDYASGSMKAIWNNIRAIDLLETLDQVDSDRIGCIGHSLGGHNTLFTAAFDTRIRAAVTSCGFTAFHHYYGGNLAGWTSDRYMPHIRDVYQNSPDKVPFDFYEVLAAISPRAIFVNAPLKDDNFENTGVQKVMDEALKAYAIYGQTQNTLVGRYPDCGHDFPIPIREEAYSWLKERLK